jgi:hypothetical protein
MKHENQSEMLQDRRFLLHRNRSKCSEITSVCSTSDDVIAAERCCMQRTQCADSDFASSRQSAVSDRCTTVREVFRFTSIVQTFVAMRLPRPRDKNGLSLQAVHQESATRYGISCYTVILTIRETTVFVLGNAAMLTILTVINSLRTIGIAQSL